MLKDTHKSNCVQRAAGKENENENRRPLVLAISQRLNWFKIGGRFGFVQILHKCWRHSQLYSHSSNFDRITFRSTIWHSNFITVQLICCWWFALCSSHPGKFSAIYDDDHDLSIATRKRNEQAFTANPSNWVTILSIYVRIMKFSLLFSFFVFCLDRISVVYTFTTI